MGCSPACLQYLNTSSCDVTSCQHTYPLKAPSSRCLSCFLPLALLLGLSLPLSYPCSQMAFCSHSNKSLEWDLLLDGVISAAFLVSDPPRHFTAQTLTVVLPLNPTTLSSDSELLHGKWNGKLSICLVFIYIPSFEKRWFKSLIHFISFICSI